MGCFADGGAVFTNDAALAAKMKMIANHGQCARYYHEIIGINSRLDTLQAAILNVKLKYLDGNNKRRNDLALCYDQALQAIPGVYTPKRDQSSDHIFHQYVIRTEKRDQLKEYLAANGIPSMIHYPLPIPLQIAYAKFNRGNTPVAEVLAKQILSLPMHPQLSLEQVDLI